MHAVEGNSRDFFPPGSLAGKDVGREHRKEASRAASGMIKGAFELAKSGCDVASLRG